MIPQKIEALFAFIDYLDANKKDYIEKYIPLCNEIKILDSRRSVLNPRKNYIGKQQYDEIQKQIAEKFEPINKNICIPILAKLKELDIWAGDDVCRLRRVSPLANNPHYEISTITPPRKERSVPRRVSRQLTRRFLHEGILYKVINPGS